MKKVSKKLKPRNPYVPASTVRNGAGKHKDKKKEQKDKFIAE